MEAQHLCGCHAKEGLHLALPLPPSFSLQMAVCTYGFFMTAPNCWFPRNHLGGGLLERPLRLANGQPVLTRVFQTTSDGSISKLTACIRGVQQLSVADRDCILAQVTRMLRLSEMESSSLAAFHSIHPQAKAKGFGRLFRSPTLFEDMVKSLLLCNCGWGRTLTMVKALCELQAELKGPYLGAVDGLIETSKKIDSKVLAPQTPEGKDLKRKQNPKKMRRLKACKSLKTFGAKVEGDNSHDFSNIEGRTETTDCQVQSDIDSQTYSSSQTMLSQTDQISVKCPTAEIVMLTNSGTMGSPCLGAFPLPEELAGLDTNFLAKRCGLGYRAKRIWKLAKDICDGTVDLKSFETVTTGQMHVEDIRSKLLQLQGFGPYTCANVLMCIGKYDTVAADTETVRHLKQVHGRSSCIVNNVSTEAAEVYAVYAPFQFLAYWFELWTCYEKTFGQLSCMDPSNYDLFTGLNMRKRMQNLMGISDS